MFAAPITGYLIMDSSIYDVHFYAWSMPSFVFESEQLLETSLTMHNIAVWLLGLGIIGHLLMLLKHYKFKRGVKLLQTML